MRRLLYLKTAVAYARYSSDNQREESISAQLRAIRAYATKNEIEIIREYVDEARSATTDDRPDFQRMVEDIRAGVISPDLVLVHKTDRFARNRYDAAVYKRQLAQAGVRVVAVDQPVDDSPEGALLESLLEGLAEYYSKNLARETLKGLKENAYQGRTTGGRPPLGYDFDAEGRYIVNEVEAAIVRRIFHEVLAGKSYTEVVEGLNRDGWRTKRGQPFGKNSIHDILVNEKYAGVLVYMKGSKKVHHAAPRKDAIRVEGIIPPIVSKEDFQAVQKKLERRKRQGYPRKRSDTLFILTGKVFCGECGGRYIGNTNRYGGQQPYHYYRCERKRRTRTCDNKPVNKEWLENLVLDQIEEALSPTMTEELAEKITALAAEKDADRLAEEKGLQREIQDIDRKIDNLLRALEDGHMDYSLIGSRLRELKDVKTQKETRLKTLQASQTGITIDMVRSYLETLRGRLIDRTDPHECREIVDRMVDRIVIYPEKIQVNLRFGLPGFWVNDGSPNSYLTLTQIHLRP